MSATLNIGPPMITEGSGSCFSIWRQTRAVYVQCGTKHKIEATNQIPHPSGVVVNCGPSNSSLPGQGKRVKCPGYAPGERGGRGRGM